MPRASDRRVEIANRHPRLRLNRRALEKLIATLDAKFRISPGDVAHLNGRKEVDLNSPAVPVGTLSLVFLTDAALAKLHGDFLGDPSPTDVITFEGDESQRLAGEICVSVDTAFAYARRHRRDFADELRLYLVHGWLHLAGYDDLTPARKRVMRRAEARAMRISKEAVGKVPLFQLR